TRPWDSAASSALSTRTSSGAPGTSSPSGLPASAGDTSTAATMRSSRRARIARATSSPMGPSPTTPTRSSTMPMLSRPPGAAPPASVPVARRLDRTPHRLLQRADALGLAAQLQLQSPQPLAGDVELPLRLGSAGACLPHAVDCVALLQHQALGARALVRRRRRRALDLRLLARELLRHRTQARARRRQLSLQALPLLRG